MGRNKKLPKIEVVTVKNGYNLRIEGHKQEYMYFTPERLLEGFMVHVGLKMTDQLSAETIRSFIDSALEWNNLKASHKEIQKLKAEIERIGRIYRGVCKRLIDERHRMLRLCEMSKDCAIGKHSLTDALARLHDQAKKDGQLKEFTLKDFGITSDQIKDDDDEETDDTSTTGD